MVVCFLKLMLGDLSSRSVLSMLVGALFKIFGLFLNTSSIENDTFLLSGTINISRGISYK
jgi:hypothetical protein